MAGKSGKGGEFERSVCKYLTKWNGGDPKKPHFWRQPGSGSMATVNNDENLSGDIRSISPESKYFCDYFSVECKNGYDDVSIDKFLKYNKSDGLRLFWQQCTVDAVMSKKHPLLIYRKLGITPVWIGVNDVVFDNVIKYLDSVRYIKLFWTEDIQDVYLFGMEDFFNGLTPEIVKSFMGEKL